MTYITTYVTTHRWTCDQCGASAERVDPNFTEYTRDLPAGWITLRDPMYARSPLEVSENLIFDTSACALAWIKARLESISPPHVHVMECLQDGCSLIP